MDGTKKWLWVRIAIVAAGGLGGISFTSPESVAEWNGGDIDWFTCVILLIACPFALLIVVGFQAINPLSAPIWRRPSWRINPFLFAEPLQGFHLAAFFFVAAGVAGIATLPFRNISAAPMAVSLLSIGLGLWLGIQLSMKAFRKKMGTR